MKQRIEIFKSLAHQIGAKKVIWRFDPIILTQDITPREILKRVWHIGNAIKGCTHKLVFSFVDIKAYRKVRNNLVRETEAFNHDNIDDAELKEEQIIEVVEGLAKLRDYWANEGWQISLATCSEQIDLDKYGVEHNRCIDGELMKELFADDEDLVYYLNTGKYPKPKVEDDLFAEFADLPVSIEKLKDKGQRKVCGCMISKDIGMYNTCPHHCVYCYANTSRKVVNSNLSKHSDDSESIID